MFSTELSTTHPPMVRTDDDDSNPLDERVLSRDVDFDEFGLDEFGCEVPVLNGFPEGPDLSGNPGSPPPWPNEPFGMIPLPTRHDSPLDALPRPAPYLGPSFLLESILPPPPPRPTRSIEAMCCGTASPSMEMRTANPQSVFSAALFRTLKTVFFDNVRYPGTDKLLSMFASAPSQGRPQLRAVLVERGLERPYGGISYNDFRNYLHANLPNRLCVNKHVWARSAFAIGFFKRRIEELHAACRTLASAAPNSPDDALFLAAMGAQCDAATRELAGTAIDQVCILRKDIPMKGRVRPIKRVAEKIQRTVGQYLIVDMTMLNMAERRVVLGTKVIPKAVFCSLANVFYDGCWFPSTTHCIGKNGIRGTLYPQYAFYRRR